MADFSLDWLIDSALADFALLIPIVGTMFLIAIAVAKLWEKSWNSAVKFSVVFLVFIVDMGAIAVMPGDIGLNFRELWAKLFGEIGDLV